MEPASTDPYQPPKDPSPPPDSPPPKSDGGDSDGRRDGAFRSRRIVLASTFLGVGLRILDREHFYGGQYFPEARPRCPHCGVSGCDFRCLESGLLGRVLKHPRRSRSR